MAYSTISKPSLHFNTKLYTGTGSELAISGVGFQPDWTWIKRRDATANGGMFDVVRGATKLISSSQTDGEQTLAQSLKFLLYAKHDFLELQERLFDLKFCTYKFLILHPYVSQNYHAQEQ